MAWSLQICRVFGIPIRLHLTFVLLIGWLGFLGLQSGNPTLFLLSVGIFGSVLLHELGHSVVAQRFGVRVLDITLLPIGGLARMNVIPRQPKEEFCIAIAGPAVNFVLGPALYVAHLAWEPYVPWMRLMDVPGVLLGKLAYANLMLGLFNLLPAFPMDGGRIFRAILAQRMPYVRASQQAAQLGQLLAYLLGFVGLATQNPMLTIIAVFVYLGAAEEAGRVQTAAFVAGIAVKDAMLTEFHSLAASDPLAHAVELLLAGDQQDFPVQGSEPGQGVVGILTRRHLFEALTRRGGAALVSEVMEPAPPPVDANEALETVMERMAGEGQTVVPVREGDRLCGLLTAENVSEYLFVRAALVRSPAG